MTRRFLSVCIAAAFTLIAFAAPAHAQQGVQRIEVCTPFGLSKDADSLTQAQQRELGIMCNTYFYGAFLCAPVKATLEAIVAYAKKYNLKETDIDPAAFAQKGSWIAHVKANAAQAEKIGAPAIQKRVNDWSQLASIYFTKTLNDGKKLTGPLLLTYIRGPEFATVCPHVKP